jgi:hypothetical protein
MKSGQRNLWNKYPEGSDTYGMVKSWGLTPENPCEIRYFASGVGFEGESLEEMSRSLNGATIEGPTSLHVCFTSLLPFSAPCARAKKLAVFAQTTCLDIFVSIDGKQQEDGLVIKHNASYTDPAVEEASPQGVWCTVTSEQWTPRGRDPNGLHLPLVVKGDPTSACLNASHDYAGELVPAFCKLFGRAGPGLHTYTIRLSPRGFVEESPFTFGESADEEKICDPLVGMTFGSDPNNASLSATFKLSVTDDVLAKSIADAKKPAPEPINAKDYKEIAEFAKKSTGSFASKAGDCLGEAVSGPPDHVVLSQSKDYGDDVGLINSEKGGRKKDQYYFVYAVVMWKGAGEDGVMLKVRLEKSMIKNYQEVGSPEWIVARSYNAENIGNAQIDGAIQRDASRF